MFLGAGVGDHQIRDISPPILVGPREGSGNSEGDDCASEKQSTPAREQPTPCQVPLTHSQFPTRFEGDVPVEDEGWLHGLLLIQLSQPPPCHLSLIQEQSVVGELGWPPPSVG